MKSSLMVTLSCLVLSACSAEQDREAEGKDRVVVQKQRSSEQLQESLEADPPLGDSILLPPFEIEVDLSVRADRELRAANETIIVTAFFQGIPRDTTLEEYVEWGEIFIGKSQVELKGDERVASFDSVWIDASQYNLLADKNFEVLVNIGSGRRSSDYNLLDTEILEASIDSIKGKRHKLSGKLIEEIF